MFELILSLYGAPPRLLPDGVPPCLTLFSTCTVGRHVCFQTASRHVWPLFLTCTVAATFASVRLPAPAPAPPSRPVWPLDWASPPPPPPPPPPPALPPAPKPCSSLKWGGHAPLPHGPPPPHMGWWAGPLIKPCSRPPPPPPPSSPPSKPYS